MTNKKRMHRIKRNNLPTFFCTQFHFITCIHTYIPSYLWLVRLRDPSSPPYQSTSRALPVIMARANTPRSPLRRLPMPQYRYGRNTRNLRFRSMQYRHPPHPVKRMFFCRRRGRKRRRSRKKTFHIHTSIRERKYKAGRELSTATSGEVVGDTAAPKTCRRGGHSLCVSLGSPSPTSFPPFSSLGLQNELLYCTATTHGPPPTGGGVHPHGHSGCNFRSSHAHQEDTTPCDVTYPFLPA